MQMLILCTIGNITQQTSSERSVTDPKLGLEDDWSLVLSMRGRGDGETMLPSGVFFISVAGVPGEVGWPKES